jgi:hypothetical protein
MPETGSGTIPATMAGTTEAIEVMPLDGRLGSAAMDGLSNAGVTPDGIRDGDPATLRALVDRRGPAVIAFCTQVCGPANATTAAAEAFARFRAALRDAPNVDQTDPEWLLRGATRHAAASMARVPAGPPPHGKLRSRGTQTCEYVPVMLAARANTALGAPDLERLSRHLDRCERCNAMAEIFHRAELSYQDPAVDTLGLDTSSVLLAALEAVPAQALGAAPAPADGSFSAHPQDGAFGHLPDLDDEIPIEQVEAPAEQLDPEALAAEPLPDEAPPVDATGEHDELDLGETVEWDVVPVLPDEPYEDDGAPAATRRGGRSRALLIALPTAVVAAFVAGALALAGVFAGEDGTPPQESPRPAVSVQAPVTTPLPVKIVKRSTAGTAANAAGATAGSPATSAAPSSSTATP